MALKIDPELYYEEEGLRLCGLDGEALRKARESGQLRHRKVGKVVLYKGEWLREWLDRAEAAGAGRAV
jgi:hypothetical protein